MESVLFLGDPGVLASFFQGWKPALATSVVQTLVNPFTNEPMTMVVETEEYTEDDDGYADACDWTRFRAAGLPTLTKEISLGSLDRLAAALGLEEPPYRRALSEPPTSETTVFELAPSMVAAVVPAEAERYAELGRALRGDLDDDMARALFGELAGLASEATGSRRLYVIQEV